MSILGNLACEDVADFAAVFGGQTTKGLSDRFIFGIAPPLDFEPVDIRRDLIEPRPCLVPGWAYEMRKQWISDIQARRRLGEIALRVALISSSCNGETEVSRASMDAALRFAEWQEGIRAAYKPGVAESKESECLEAIASELNREYEKQGKGARVIPHPGAAGTALKSALRQRAGQEVPSASAVANAPDTVEDCG